MISEIWVGSLATIRPIRPKYHSRTTAKRLTPVKISQGSSGSRPGSSIYARSCKRLRRRMVDRPKPIDPAGQRAWAPVPNRLGQYARVAPPAGRVMASALAKPRPGDQYRQDPIRTRGRTMNLFVHLVLRLAGVVLLCLACAVGWVLVDTHRTIEKEAAASADRVAGALETLYWRELLWRGGLSRQHLVPHPGLGNHGDDEGHLARRLHHLLARQRAAARPVQPAGGDRRSGAGLVPGLLRRMSSAPMPGSNGPCPRGSRWPD